MKMVVRTSTVLLIMASLLTGCQPQEIEEPPDNVAVQLKWVHQAQFAGMYAADTKGFYVDENINVTLHPGGLDKSPEQIVR